MWPVPSLVLEVPHNGGVHLRNSLEDAPQGVRFLYPFCRPSSQINSPLVGGIHPSRSQYCTPSPSSSDQDNTGCLWLISRSQPHTSFPIALDILVNHKILRYKVDITRRDAEDPTSVDITFALQATYSLKPGLLYHLRLFSDREPLDIGWPSKTLVKG